MRSKINPAALDDLFATSAPPPGSDVLATYDPPVPCTCCGTTTGTAYTNPAPPLCRACATDPKPRLDAAEREVLRREQQLAEWDAWFEAEKTKATDRARARYDQLQDQIRLSISDPARYAELQAGIDATIAAGGPLGLLLAAMRSYDQAAVQLSAHFDQLSHIQSALLRCRAAHGWTIPDDVATARLRLGQPGTDRPDELSHAISQMRLAAA